MLPMGTIVTILMFVGLIFASDLPVLRNCPRLIKNTAAIFVLAGGLWNTLWYGLQHLTEFWGIAALVSGILMVIASLFLLAPDKLPSFIHKWKPIILVVLLGYGLMYAITIARL